LYPVVQGTSQAVKGIDALDRFDNTGTAPNTLIFSLTIHDRSAGFSYTLILHGKSPWLRVLLGSVYPDLYHQTLQVSGQLDLLGIFSCYPLEYMIIF
jgi:hypothetical protein